MRRLLLLLALLCAVPAYAQNPNPPGHGETHVKHRIFKGGQVHEAETDGVTDGIVFWKNGTSQRVHNGKLGTWFPATFADEGTPVNSDGGDARNDFSPVPVADGNTQLFRPTQTLGLTTPTAAYMANMLTSPLVRAGTSIIDAYILISPQQVTAYGGLTSAVNQAHLMIDSTNDALAHSGVDARFNLVGVAQDTVAETSGLSSNLYGNSSALYERWTSGQFSALRTSTGFDVLARIVTQGDLCGQAWVYSSSLPLAVINGTTCAVSNMSYAHEHGHTMGLMHNIGDSGYAAVCGATAVGYGETRFRTVMSYPSVTIDGVARNYGPRTRQYSAPPPAVWYSDGVSAVGEARTNASACLVITTPVVAGWHASNTPPPPTNHTAPTNVAWSPSTLTWTHTRTADLSFYKVADNGGTATNLGTPPTNSATYSLANGDHSLVLSACYSDTTCNAATALVFTTGNTSIAYVSLVPADGYVYKVSKGKGKTLLFSVSATDDSGIKSVVLHFGSTGTSTAVKSGDTYTVNLKPSRGTYSWYFTITANDGEIVNTTTRTLTVQ